MNTMQYNQSSIVDNQDGDIITQLPSDQTQPSHNELQIVNTLFKEHRQTMNVVFDECKDAVLVGLLFIAFTSIPQIDDFIRKILPISNKSNYFFIGCKVIIVICLFWIIKHFYLSKKNS